jgi:hypothetical protein
VVLFPLNNRTIGASSFHTEGKRQEGRKVKNKEKKKMRKQNQSCIFRIHIIQIEVT